MAKINRREGANLMHKEISKAPTPAELKDRHQTAIPALQYQLYDIKYIPETIK